jgi:hypothetical protein
MLAAKTILMIKRISHIICVLLSSLFFIQCHSKPEEIPLHYELVNADKVTDSLSAHWPNYQDDFTQWKTVYENCVHDSLFRDAFYLGLQTNLGIGSVSNEIVQNINGKITVLDTSGNRDILNIIAINKSANCFSRINLNKNLQDSFYTELTGNLMASGDYAYLVDIMDTSQIIFKITTLIDYAIRLDTLVSRLQHTRDSSLLYFSRMLTTPSNALMVRAAMIFGFSADFHLKRKLTQAEENSFKNEAYFKPGDLGATGSIRLLPDQDMRVIINKNYTVFGQFYLFRQ